MPKYKFNQIRKVTTVEKTLMVIEANSYEEAVIKAEKLSPFSEHEGAYDECYEVISLELDEDMAMEIDTDDNNGEATVETYYGDKLVFDNTPSEETGKLRINRLLNEGILGPFYIGMGIQYMKQCLDLKPDEEVYQDFCGLFSPAVVRNTVNYMHKKVFPEQYEIKTTK